MYGTKRTRLLRIEARRRPVGAEVTDRSPWDWYGQSCSCGLPPGECRASPSPREPAPARRRLASVGLCGRARGGQDARRRLLGSAPRRDRRHEARLSDRPDHGRYPRRHGRWPLRSAGGRSTVVPAAILAFEAPRFLAQRGPRGLHERRKARSHPRGKRRHPVGRRFRLLAASRIDLGPGDAGAAGRHQSPGDDHDDRAGSRP